MEMPIEPVTRSFAGQGRGALARRSGYLSPASDISTFLYGRAESHSVVTKTPRSASSASSRSNSAFSLSGSLSANLRYLAARSRLMATHLPTQNLSTKPGIVPAPEPELRGLWAKGVHPPCDLLGADTGT